MLDGLLGRSGFSSKCKSLIKPTRTRIEVLRRRAEAKQRFLKEDLAKLLANGLDVNAYGRTEEFIAGLNLLSCYTFIDQSCEYILKQLSVMQKLGQCPEECRETVASLMFAAARFSDLPELRDLRDVFQERYGSGLECFVNQVFVEKLASKPPAVEKRIKLLQDIAAEFSIQWESRGFKQRMDKPSTLAQDQAKKLGPLSVADDKYRTPNGNNVFRKNDQRSKERIEHAHKETALHNDGNVIVRNIPFVDTEENGNAIVRNIPAVGREEKRPKERMEHTHKDPALHNDRNVIVRNIPFVGREENENVIVRNISFVGREEKRPKERIEHAHKETALHNDRNVIVRNIPFVDTKENGNVIVRNIPVVGREGKRSKERIEHAHKEPALHNDGNVRARRKEVLDIPIVGRDEKRDYKHEVLINKAENNGYFSKAKQESTSGKNDTPSLLKSSGSSYRDTKPDIPDNDRVVNGDEDVGVKSTRKVQVEEVVKLKSCYNGSLPPPYVKPNIPPPYSKPIHSDKIHKKQDGARDDLSPHIVPNSDHGVGSDIPLPKPRSIRRKHSKSSSSHDDVGSSEDARIVKRISSSRRKERKGLQILFDDEHYRKDEEEKMMDKLLLHYSKKPSAYDVGKLRKKKSRSNTSSKSPHHRSNDEAEMIVPPTRSISLPHEQSGESESKKVYARANSFQPDNQAPHVHPKLPDYDDLAARFAALRGG